MRRALLIALVPALIASAAGAATPTKPATPPAPAASAPASAPPAAATPAPAAPAPAAASTPPATPLPPADPTTTDIRCIIVGGALSQNSDPDLQKLGNASMLYFWGRLEGRGALQNINARVIQEAAQLTAAQLTAEVNVCGAILTGATQGLQGLGDAIQQNEGNGPGAAPPRK
ncbi:MAG TPA: hypothetical protein VGL58_07085 [Caulobacteraceae bacterium]|jgi:hypothetical protein